MAISADKLHFIDVDGIRTRYYDSGTTGTPIVLIHGAHAGFAIPIGIEQWDLNVDALAEHGRVVAYDKLGQGFTGSPASDDDYTFASTVAHTIALFEALQLRDATLVGHSRGGLLALHLAIVRPDLVKRLITVSSAANVIHEDHKTLDLGDFTPDQLVDALAMAQATDRPAPENFKRFVRDVAVLPKLAAERAAYARVGHTLFEPSLVEAEKVAMQHLDATGIDQPTLVMWGQNDRTAPVELAAPLFARIAAKAHAPTWLTVINRAGHNFFIDQPEAFNAAVIGFLDQ